MKIVSIKFRVLYILEMLIFLAFLSCQGNQKNTVKEKADLTPKQEYIQDKSKGYYVSYPFTEETTYLLDNENTSVGLLKIISEKDIIYKINLRQKDQEYGEWEIPIDREVIDFTPILKKNLDPVLEKNYYKSKKENFVIEIEYGTAHVKWSYLYQIDMKLQKLYLKDIFYLEPVENNSPEIINSSYYLCRFPINKTMDKLPIEYIDSLYQNFDKVRKNGKFVRSE
jgi:hypothetical protein